MDLPPQKVTNQEAEERARMPTGTSNILNARSLEASHHRLAELLQPGMHVLDVGCGTGAITRGIAEAVGPDGKVTGVDINPDLIAQARTAHGELANLKFVASDLRKLDYGRTFDIVNSARVIQWLARPLDAVRSMAAATRIGGLVLLLDYNHQKMECSPEPPGTFRLFYDRFLLWRSDAGMENDIADRMPAMLRQVGLTNVTTSPQHEIVRRSDTDFTQRATLWADVAATRGFQMTADGYVTEDERSAAEAAMRLWATRDGEWQAMYLMASEGTV
jgi:ubiquinone/menaquinone biosynthesis C-methylase UbiE